MMVTGGMFYHLLPRLILPHFVPHGIEDGEGTGKAKSQNPAEVPHDVSP
jgi:hypothetical protein